MLSPVAIGPYRIDPIALAPMAGVTDRPFRQICRDQGAGYTVSEMVTSDSRLWHTAKSSFRLNHEGEPGPRSVQILGYDPVMMAEAARLNVERGAQIIDINMGCPAKKVCNRLAGSALMQDEALVADILHAVVQAVDVPVTLKTRTGWNRDNRNGVTIARIAEDAGIRMLVIHGRTRADKYEGQAEYDTVAAIKQAVSIPVLANGDINSPEKALTVLQQTGCDGIMLGRAAHGRPWIFREIRHFLSTRILLSPPDLSDQIQVSLDHLAALHAFYGEELGVRFARKHIGWYAQYWEQGRDFVRRFHALTTGQAQRAAVQAFQASCREGFPVIS
ncbi:tRNA-U20-dihydrouridine synthase [Fluviicoccus keumensis]|uniref:tRNA-dihydrouridine synthase B n=1 Tax=Fluviicoccus keumensis TaxID=1435465 RepID=A0A4V2G3G0_9GAMM|nr:tRNA dihydrouridine synthase DusB [Fluviicoccus keumensis]RZU36836.1 tRNA-U20-dihydrouridine synthase [Fluviicoccus keumensis]